MTWRDRLGLVAKPSRDGKSIVGTGFWVTPNRVLTSRHVVENASSLRISPVTGGSIELAPEAILWFGSDPLDVAILAADHPEPAKLASFAFGQPIHETSRCEAAGFPRIGFEAPREKDVAGQIFDISGSLHPATAKRPTLQLSAEQDFAGVQDLAGISGAPVFVKGQLQGLIRGGPRLLRGDVLHVVSYQSLSDIPELAELLGFSPMADQCKELRKQVWELLTAGTSSDLVMALAPRVEEILQTKLPKPGLTAQAETLAEVLCERCEYRDVLRICTRLIRSCLESNQQRLARKVEELLNILLPLSVFREFRQRSSEQRPGVMRLPFVEKAFAEFVRAAIEGRSMAFLPSKQDPLRPRNAFIAPKPPASGGSLRLQQQELLADLYQRLFGEESVFERLLDDDHKRNLRGFEASDQVEQRLTIIRNILAFKKDEDQEVFYLLVEHDTAKHAAYSEQSEAFLASLRDLLPDLEVVIMTGEPKEYGAEQGALLPLRQLFKGPKRGRSHS